MSAHLKNFPLRLLVVLVSVALSASALVGIGVTQAPPASAAKPVIDPSFNLGTLLNDDVNSLAAVEVDGVQKVFVGGEFTGAEGNDRIVLLNLDGSVDTSFNPGALLNAQVRSVALVTIGDEQKVLVGGDFTDAGDADNDRVVLLNFDGSVDSDFSPGGLLTNVVNSAKPVTIGSDLKFLLGGPFINIGDADNDRVVLLNRDGSVDTDFSPGGLINNNVNTVEPVTVGSDLKFMIGGQFTDAGDADNDRVVMLNPDASVDSVFSPGGLFSGSVSSIQSMTVDSQQKLLLGGSFINAGTADNDRAAMLNLDGTMDPTFSPGGLFSGAVYSATAVTVGGQQKFLFGGLLYGLGGTAKLQLLNRDGSVDPALSVGTTLSGEVNSVVVLSIGGQQKYLVGGNFTNAGGNDRVALLNGPLEAPEAPSKPTGVTGGEGEVDVTIEPSATGDPADSYIVTSQPDGKECTVAANAPELKCTVEDLTPGASYTFTVTAINTAGTSDPSEASDPVTAGETPEPTPTPTPEPSPTPTPTVVKPNQKPASLKVKGKSTAKKWKVTWKKPANSSKTRPVTKYKLTAQLRGGKKIALTRNLKGSATSTTLTRKQLLRALRSLRGEVNARKYVFTLKLAAGNKAGNGPARSVRLIVK